MFHFGIDSMMIMDKSERTDELFMIPASETQDVNLRYLN